MRKAVSLIAALALLLCACGATAESVRDAAGIDVPSSWTDPENERATVNLLPGEILSADYTGKPVMEIFWADSAWDEWVFTLVLEPETDGDSRKTYSFEHGTAVRYTYDEDGNRIDEAASNEAFSGRVTAERDENHETVLTLECDNAALPNMTLHRDRMPCPSPEELAANVIEPVLELEDGSAGIGLKQAVTAEKLIRYAVLNRLYAVDPEEFTRNLKAALRDLELSEEETQKFLEQKNALTDLILNVSGLSGDGSMEKISRARSVFSDAGVMESVDETMETSLSAAYSVERLVVSLDTLGNGGEE